MKKVMKNTPVQVLLDKIGIQKAGGEGPTPTPEVIAQSIGVKIKQGNLVIGHPNDPMYTWRTTYRKNDGKVYQLGNLAVYIDEMLELQEDIYEMIPSLPRDLGGVWIAADDEIHAVHCNMTAEEVQAAIDENDNIAIFNACDKVYDSEDNALYDIVDVNPHTSLFGTEYGRFVAAATGETFTWEGEEYKVMFAHNIYDGHEDTTALLYGRIAEVDGNYYIITYYMKDGEFVPFQTKPTYDDRMNYNRVWTTDGVVDEYISYGENPRYPIGNVIPCPNATPENPSYGYNVNSQIVYRVGISDNEFPLCTLETRSAVVGENVNLYGYPIGVIETVEGASSTGADANAGADTATGPIVVQISVDGKEWTTVGKTLDDDTNVITNIPRGLFFKFSEDVNITEG